MILGHVWRRQRSGHRIFYTCYLCEARLDFATIGTIRDYTAFPVVTVKRVLLEEYASCLKSWQERRSRCSLGKLDVAKETQCLAGGSLGSGGFCREELDCYPSRPPDVCLWLSRPAVVLAAAIRAARSGRDMLQYALRMGEAACGPLDDLLDEVKTVYGERFVFGFRKPLTWDDVDRAAACNRARNT